MALGDAVIWEVRASANDLNGGGYRDAGGSSTDYSQQTNAELTVTDLDSTGSTFTSTTGGFTAEMVGNLICVDDGGTYDWYEITGHTDTNTITVDRSPGTDFTGADGRVGGALLTCGGLARALIAIADDSAFPSYNTGMAWLKGSGGTDETLSTTTINVPGGPVNTEGTNFDGQAFIVKGYQSTRGDNLKYRIDAGTQAVAIMMEFKGGSDGAVHIHNVILDGNDTGGTTSLFGGNTSYNSISNCEMIDSAGGGVSGIRAATNCIARGCANTGISVTVAVRCQAYDNGTGISASYSFYCISSKNGTGFTGSNYVFAYCAAYDNTNDGFKMTNNQRGHNVIGCVGYGNGAYDLEGSVSNRQINATIIDSAFGNYRMVGDILTDEPQFFNKITLTVDPWVDADGEDYELNNTAGGGALCREADTLGKDIGPIQHVSAGGTTIENYATIF